MDIKIKAYNEAIKVIEKCKTPKGFRAAFPGYNGIWARDSVITSLGASLLQNKFKQTFKQSLITLAKYQAPNGQIPNAFINNHGEYQSIDSSLWYIIGHLIFKQRYNDTSLFNSERKKIEKALLWLSCQDLSNNGMLVQQPTTDWQDAFPHKYGHTINTQTLYYLILNLLKKTKEANKLRINTNTNKDTSLWNGSFYLPYRWKNHNKYQEGGDWFDSLGNLLAIVFDLADEKQAISILNHIEKNKINKPFPVKAIYPPITRSSEFWHEYYEDCAAKDPYHYLNGGIWTYIGGFYVLALIKLKQFNKAKKELENLARANLQSPMFNEWLHGESGKPGLSGDSSLEGNQAWNAGMYLLAFESLKKKKILI